MSTHPKNRIACFISPHGYGHAARAAAVMETLHHLDPDQEFEIFTTVPEWFFRSSLSGAFTYHPLLTDIGLVQKNPFQANLEKTLDLLDQFYPLDPQLVRRLAESLTKKKCRLIVCDIAPMGILVAEEAGIPSLLIENFTWDWIYEEYLHEDERPAKHIHYLKALFDKADYRIQTVPVCLPAPADLTTSPVCRKSRTAASEIRNTLGIPAHARVVMITMGGIAEQYRFLGKLTEQKVLYFILPGASEKITSRGNLVLLPHHSECFHPDLVNASDALIGKVGYSTLSEVYWAGIPFGYIARDDFRESPVLTSFIEKNMRGVAIAENEFASGVFVSRLPELFALGRVERQGLNGADQVARFIFSLMKKTDS